LQVLGDDIAVLAYNVREEATVDGKRVTLDAADASTWRRRDGHRVCALRGGAIGSPPGRHRLGPCEHRPGAEAVRPS
jgi:hypothetical protein